MRFFTRTRTVGTLVALTIGLVAWLASNDAIASLTIGILGEIVALLIDMHYSISDELEKFGRAEELRSLMPRGGRDTPDLLEYAKNYSDVTANGHEFLAQYARERMLEAVGEMQQLQKGHMEIGPGLVQLKGADILRTLKVSGFATALGHLYDFWLPEQRGKGHGIERQFAVGPDDQDDESAAVDDAKRDYQLQSLDAVRKRKIPITRVFLLESANVTLPGDFVELIDDQRQAGVEVRVAYVDRLPVELQKDFAIWDDRLVAHVNWAHSVVPGTDGEPIITSTVTGTTYHTSRVALMHAQRDRDTLRESSVSWETARPRHVRREMERGGDAD